MDKPKKKWRDLIKDFLNKEPENLFDCKKDSFGMPITGGSLFNTYQYLKTIEQGDLRVYLQMILTLQYKRQQLRIINSPLLEPIQDSIFTIALLYGSVGVRINSNKEPILYGINLLEYDKQMQPYKAQGIRGVRAGFGIPYTFKKKETTVELTSDTTAFLTFGEEALSLWVRILPFGKAKINMLHIWGKNAKFNKKKMKLKIRTTDSDLLDYQLLSATNPNCDVILEFDQGLPLNSSDDDKTTAKQIASGWKKTKVNSNKITGEPNTFEPFLEKEDPNRDTKLDYKFIEGEYNKFASIRHNEESKVTRLTAGEGNASLARCYLEEADWESSVAKFIKKWNKISGENATFISKLPIPFNNNGTDKDHSIEQEEERI